MFHTFPDDRQNLLEFLMGKKKRQLKPRREPSPPPKPLVLGTRWTPTHKMNRWDSREDQPDYHVVEIKAEKIDGKIRFQVLDSNWKVKTFYWDDESENSFFVRGV